MENRHKFMILGISGALAMGTLAARGDDDLKRGERRPRFRVRAALQDLQELIREPEYESQLSL